MTEITQPIPARAPVESSFEGQPITLYWYGERLCMVVQDVGRILGYSGDGGKLLDSVRDDWSAEFVLGRDYAVVPVDEARAIFGVSRQSRVTRAGRGIAIFFESGMNLACLKTNKPAGVRLRRELSERILPQIARTGAYVPDAAPALPAPVAPAVEPHAPTVALSATIDSVPLEVALAVVTRAETTGLLTARDATLRQAAILKAHGCDILSDPRVTFQRSEVAEAVAALAPGEAVRITRTLDTSAYYTANELGRAHGLSGIRVGKIARELGIHGVEGYGMKRRLEGNDNRGTVIEHWLFSEKARLELEPHLAAAAERAKVS